MRVRPVRPAALAAVLLSGCIFDPHARLDDADLRVVVTSVNPEAAKLALSVKAAGPGGAVYIRVPEVAARTSIELYFPTLPPGRYRLSAREFDADARVLRCATLGPDVDAAVSPQDKTFDMAADASPCSADAPDAAPSVDAAPSLDAALSLDALVVPVPDAAVAPPVDAELDPDVPDSRRPPIRDMRLRKDADEDDPQH